MQKVLFTGIITLLQSAHVDRAVAYSAGTTLVT